MVPKWYPWISCSPDGIILGTDGMIEIKSPENMYGPLKNRIEKLANGYVPKDKYEHSHIWPSHYAQMQGSMYILQKSWCYYLVSSVNDGSCYQEMVLFNPDYWTKVLWPGIQNFVENELKPRLMRLGVCRNFRWRLITQRQ